MSGSHLIATALLLVALAGCAGPSAGGTAATPPPAPAPSAEPPSVDDRFTPDIPAELRVTDPKDARGQDPCDLLTDNQLAELGLDPQSARSDTTRYAQVCAWKHADGSTNASVGLSVDPAAEKLPDIYRLREALENVGVLQIAGHPALRGDDAPTGQCTLFVAVADEQLLIINGYLDGRELPEPCAQARRMAELILSNLPPQA